MSSEHLYNWLLLQYRLICSGMRHYLPFERASLKQNYSLLHNGKIIRRFVGIGLNIFISQIDTYMYNNYKHYK